MVPSPTFTPFEAAEIEQSIGDRFEKIARAHPHRIAVRLPASQWTYAELDAAANRIGRAVLRECADRNRPVALLLESGGPLFAAMIGCLKAGRFYVPIDPALDPVQIRTILREAAPALLLADRAGRDCLERLGERPAAILRAEELLVEGEASCPRVAVSPDDLAYVLFTSGSTAAPKGVIQNHRNVLHNVLKLTNGLAIAPEDRLTLLSSASFSASVSDVYGALLNGAAVCPFSLRGDGLLHLRSFLAAEGVTVYHSVPSVFRRFVSTLNGAEDFSKLRLVKLGGEPVLASDFDLYRRHFPKGCLFHVGLGSTEMAVIRQWFADAETPCPSPIAPLGYAVDGTEVVLLDEQGRETDGETGEIAVISRTHAVGYWNRPQLTAEAFRPAPGRDGLRIFPTGDLGRMLPDACLLYVGRKDSRIKVRGHRVEIAEVEAALHAMAGVREAVVAAQEGREGTKLVAYLEVDEPGRFRPAALRRSLRDRLPDYMIPSSFLVVDALPRTASGKVDRNALPQPGSARPALETPLIEPRDELEKMAARVFAEVLGLEIVGADDDFFDLGGSSLLVIEALLRLSDCAGRELGAADFLEAPTPAGLAARLRSGAVPSAGLVTLQAGSRHRPVFVVPNGSGDGEDLFVDVGLARRVGADHRFVGFRSGPAPHPSVDEIAVEYVRRMRSVQPHGPYVLVGECAGGILAFALARRLAAENERIALLALLDTPFPTKTRRFWHRLRWLREPWGENLVRRLRHHRQAAQTLPLGRRVGYAVAKARSVARGLLSLRLATRRRRVRQRASYIGRMLEYRPEIFSGRIHLIQSEEGSRAGLASAWAPFAESITVVNVPGDHHTFLREHVHRVADALRTWLEEAGAPEER